MPMCTISIHVQQYSRTGNDGTHYIRYQADKIKAGNSVIVIQPKRAFRQRKDQFVGVLLLLLASLLDLLR